MNISELMCGPNIINLQAKQIYLATYMLITGFSNSVDDINNYIYIYIYI